MTRQEAKTSVKAHMKKDFKGNIIIHEIDNENTIHFEIMKPTGRYYFGTLKKGQKPGLEFDRYTDDFK